MEQQGYNNLIESDNKKLYSAALYMRFSKDDGQVNDSSSITTQKMMLEKYCLDNGFRIYDSYVDDGYTGLNFDRPDFQRLLTDIDDGKVNMVITKDLSRLGRDYIQTGYYSEVFFSERNVRYIAINDGFDSLKSDNDIAPFKNILNNMYSKDLSRKIKSAVRQRVSHGLFCFGQVPYGYKKLPDNKNKLVVDEDAAETVKEIFRLALEGKGGVSIMKILTARQVLNPSAYRTERGDTRFEVYHKGKHVGPYKWNVSTVNKIMRDRAYVGDTVGGKTEIINFRTKKKVLSPRSKHIVVENTHEPIISRDDFGRVQDFVKARNRPSRYCEENLFKGILFCGHCGKRMSLNVNVIKAKKKTSYKKIIYRCYNHTVNPNECPQHNQINYVDFKERVWQSVRKVLNLMQSDSRTLEAVRKRIAGQNNSDKLNAEKAKLEKRLTALTTIIRKLYEDYAAERLDEVEYQGLLAGYQAEKKTLNERLAGIITELDKTDDREESLRKLKLLAALYADSTELTSEIVHKFIERIEVKRAQIVDGKEIREINIVYRFINTNL